MPSTNGWQLAALIKQISAHTPIIMVTGQSKEEVMDNMQGGDVDFMIFKPIKFNKLYEAIQASWAMKPD
jgi:FixJ family two-component response regulator